MKTLCCAAAGRERAPSTGPVPPGSAVSERRCEWRKKRRCMARSRKRCDTGNGGHGTMGETESDGQSQAAIEKTERVSRQGNAIYMLVGASVLASLRVVRFCKERLNSLTATSASVPSIPIELQLRRRRSAITQILRKHRTAAVANTKTGCNVERLVNCIQEMDAPIPRQ